MTLNIKHLAYQDLDDQTVYSMSLTNHDGRAHIFRGRCREGRYCALVHTEEESPMHGVWAQRSHDDVQYTIECFCANACVLRPCRYTLYWCANGAQSPTGTSCCAGQSVFLWRDDTIQRWVSATTILTFYTFIEVPTFSKCDGSVLKYTLPVHFPHTVLFKHPPFF